MEVVPIAVKEETAIFDPVQLEIDKVKKCTLALKKLDLFPIDEKGNKKVTEILSTWMKETSNAAISGKKHLDTIKLTLKSEVRVNLYNATLKSFHDTMMTWNSTYSTAKIQINERKKRLLRNLPLDVALSDDQINGVIDSGKEATVMMKVLMNEDLSDLQDIIADVESRHVELLKLERNVVEVLELFKDFAVLVDNQEEKLQIITHNLDSSAKNVQKAETKLKDGEKSQKCGRKLTCCLFMLCIVILIVILAVTGVFGKILNSS
jgi:t-SNARE complex subunit (syntaxin)